MLSPAMQEMSRRMIAELTPRPLSEWSEEDGNVLWWQFPIGEPPYVGTPNDLGYTVEAEMVMRRHGEQEVAKLIREQVGGWPGYHTHWTRIIVPEQPLPADMPATE